MEKSRYSEKIFELQDNIRIKIPATLQSLQLHLNHIKIDLETANKQPKTVNEEGKESYPIKIDGVEYTDRKKGGEALKMAIGGNIGSLAEGKTVHIGEYRGMQLSIMLDPMAKKTKACLTGEKKHYCELNPETDAGNIIRLDNCINNIEKDISQTQEKIDTLNAELAQMKIDVEVPFPLAEELFNAESELEQVHEELTKFELSDDTMHKEIYDRVREQFPDVLFGKTEYMRLEAGEGWDRLSVELHGDIFSMAHTYEQNGDLMYDPLICFKVDYGNEKLIPISYENSGLGIYESYDPNAEPTPQTVQNINGVLEFMDTWLDNIEQQGYVPVAEDVITEEKTVSFSGMER